MFVFYDLVFLMFLMLVWKMLQFTFQNKHQIIQHTQQQTQQKKTNTKND